MGHILRWLVGFLITNISIIIAFIGKYIVQIVSFETETSYKIEALMVFAALFCLTLVISNLWYHKRSQKGTLFWVCVIWALVELPIIWLLLFFS
jgi:hypothetical protein